MGMNADRRWVLADDAYCNIYEQGVKLPYWSKVGYVQPDRSEAGHPQGYLAGALITIFHLFQMFHLLHYLSNNI